MSTDSPAVGGGLVRWAGGQLASAALGLLLFYPAIILVFEVRDLLGLLDEPMWDYPADVVLVLTGAPILLVATAFLGLHRRLRRGRPGRDALYWSVAAALLLAPAAVFEVGGVVIALT